MLNARTLHYYLYTVWLTITITITLTRWRYFWIQMTKLLFNKNSISKFVFIIECFNRYYYCKILLYWRIVSACSFSSKIYRVTLVRPFFELKKCLNLIRALGSSIRTIYSQCNSVSLSCDGLKMPFVLSVFHKRLIEFSFQSSPINNHSFNSSFTLQWVLNTIQLFTRISVVKWMLSTL